MCWVLEINVQPRSKWWKLNEGLKCFPQMWYHWKKKKMVYTGGVKGKGSQISYLTT
jgi:hypothetical protein